MKEAVGLFETMDQLQLAVKELERTDFPRDSISVLGHHDEMSKNFPHFDLSVEAYEDDPNVARQAPVRSEEKTIGATVLVGGAAYLGAMAAALSAGAVTFPAIIAAAAIGGTGGAAIGGVLAKVFGDRYDHSIQEQIEKGGLLLWVRTPDEAKEQEAMRILNSFNARHVHIHEI